MTKSFTTAYLHINIPVHVIDFLVLTYLPSPRIAANIGSGHFGTVHRGVWQIKGGKIEVAVKALKPDAPEEEQVKFLQEAAIMGQWPL